MDLSGSGLNGAGERAPGRERCTVTDPRVSEGEALTPLTAPPWGQRSAALGPEPPAPCPSRDSSTLHGEAHLASLTPASHGFLSSLSVHGKLKFL